MYELADLEIGARRRLPRQVYDFIAGGAGGESALANNADAFERLRLVPRTLTDAGTRTTKVRLLGRDYAAPLGISPMGLCNLAWPGTDDALAITAHREEIPYCLAMAGSSALADMHGLAGEHLWYQVYPISDDALFEGQLCIAEQFGIENLILTVDVPLPARRLRDMRNGFSAPLAWTPSLLFEFMRHPKWSLATLAHGAPRLRNMESMVAEHEGRQHLTTILARFAGAVPNWTTVERLRARWKRKLIVKGVLNAEDAARIAALGADAIMVSNHGGRQLSSVVSPLEALPAIRRSVPSDFTLILDSGVRCGEDIVKAMAVGADFVMAGRPFLFGAAALGPRGGVATAIRILKDELDTALAQIGCDSPAALRTCQGLVAIGSRLGSQVNGRARFES